METRLMTTVRNASAAQARPATALRFRAWGAAVLGTLLAAPTTTAAGVQIGITGPPGLVYLGAQPTPSPLYERVPMHHRLDLKVRFVNNTGKPLTFDEGEVFFVDDQGALLGQVTLTGEEFLARRTIVEGSAFAEGIATVEAANSLTGEQAGGVTLDGMGRIVIAGYGVDDAQQGRLLFARFLPDGNLDDAFDGDGKLIVANASFQTLRAFDIVAVGADRTAYGGTGMLNTKRVMIGGEISAGGAAGSLRTVSVDGDASALATAVDSQSRQLLAGWAQVAGKTVFAVARFQAGSFLLDSAFANQGVALTDIPEATGETIVAMAIDAQDRPVVLGQGLVDGRMAFILLRYRADNGNPDPSFGGNGLGWRITGLAGEHMLAGGLALEPGTGRIYAAGNTSDGLLVLLARYSSAGVLDASYDWPGNDGYPGLSATGPGGDWRRQIADLILDSEGRPVLAGTASNPGEDHPLFTTARFTSVGAPDPTFLAAGSINTEIEERSAHGAGVVQLNDGRYITAGHSTKDASVHFSLARYTEKGWPDRSIDIPTNTTFQIDLLDFPFFHDYQTQPFDGYDPKVTPAKLNIQLKFNEFGTPLFMSGIQPEVYRRNQRSYRYPVRNPAFGYWSSGNGHEAFRSHTGNPSQRFAYDIGVVNPDLPAGHKRRALRPEADSMVAGLIEQYQTHPGFDPNRKYGPGDFNECFLCYGEPIHAMADGVIVFVQEGVENNWPVGVELNGGGGNWMIIDHGNGEFSMYAHMIPGTITDALGTVVAGVTPVTQGQVIGKLGNSGASTGPHLHFQINDSYDGANINNSQCLPMYFVDAMFQTSETGPWLRQLRAAAPSNTLIRIIDQPFPDQPDVAPRVYGPGAAQEIEDPPNSRLNLAHALLMPIDLSGSIGTDEGLYLADGGDPVEDVYKFHVPKKAKLTATLDFAAGADLDFHLYDLNLWPLEPDRGATRKDTEGITTVLEPGIYFLFVSRYDTPERPQAVNYRLQARLDRLPSDLKIAPSGDPSDPKLVLTYSAEDDDVIIEATSILGTDAAGGPAPWSPLEIRPERVDDVYRVTIPWGRDPARYFRLRRNTP
ncbi:MAG: peptidoglycan DD-metalloendopeptidase family protein [Verrucomicrobiales bacterium]|nr:peptidoglycan DD-metalloendopeptidase family protein [Verrucomicrobiales bacterium]